MKKRFFSLVCCFILIWGISTMSVSATSVYTPNHSLSANQNIEYFEDGSYVITEWDTTTASTRTPASKTKKSTAFLSCPQKQRY